MAAPRILLVPLECLTAHEARGWSYVGHFAVEDGLRAHGVDVTVLPAWSGGRSSDQNSWLRRAREVVGDRPFDQVWVWLFHCHLERDFLEWVASLAPVRVGVLWESLDYTEEECAVNEGLRHRKARVLKEIGSLTHLLAVDEADVDTFNAERGVQAFWLHNAVPANCLVESPTPSPIPRTAFFGSVYGSRVRYLRRAEQEGLLVRPHPPESTSVAPNYFDALNFKVTRRLRQSADASFTDLQAHVSGLREARRRVFVLWLRMLGHWAATANLPSMVKCYTGRVEEAMSAGSVVISYRIDGRPRNLGLFEDGREILLYDRDDIEGLCEHARRVSRDARWVRSIAERALLKVRTHHTMEQRVRQILAWIQSGGTHDYVSAGDYPWDGTPAFGASTVAFDGGTAWRREDEERAFEERMHACLEGSPFEFTAIERSYLTEQHLMGRYYLGFALRDVDERRHTSNGTRALFIWGAGARGRMLLESFRDSGTAVDGFVDSDPGKQGESVNGVPVFSPDVLAGTLDGAMRPFVVIGSMFVRQIARRLEAFGFEEERDYLSL